MYINNLIPLTIAQKDFSKDKNADVFECSQAHQH